MAVKASDVLNVLIMADQLMAGVARVVAQISDMDGATEPQLQAQLKALRERNTERFDTAIAALEARATK